MNIPLFILDKVYSTMSEIKKTKYSFYNNVAILANQQTKGRGRRQNIWVSEKGNLYLSIRLKKTIKNNHHLATYMVSIIVYDTIRKYLSKKIKTYFIGFHMGPYGPITPKCYEISRSLLI